MRLSLLDQDSANPSRGMAAAQGRNKGNLFFWEVSRMVRIKAD